MTATARSMKTCRSLIGDAMRILVQYSTGEIHALEIVGTVGIEIDGRRLMVKDLKKILSSKEAHPCDDCKHRPQDTFSDQCFGCKMVEGGRPTHWEGEEV